MSKPKAPTWDDGSVRHLAHYLAELNGGYVTLRPRPIMESLCEWLFGWWITR